MSKVLIITSSLRVGSNSDIIAEQVRLGAISANHDAEVISLKGKDIKFCIGCLSCQKTGKCVIKDDIPVLMEKVKLADTLVFVTPIYYYEMSGQLKTFLDRMNPLYGSDYNFRNVYLVTTAADDAEYTPTRAINGLGGWVECFEEATLVDTLFLEANNNPNEIRNKPDQLKKAFEFGTKLK